MNVTDVSVLCEECADLRATIARQCADLTHERDDNAQFGATIAQLRAQLASERDDYDTMSAQLTRLHDEIARRDMKFTVLLGENVAMTQALRERDAALRDANARLRMELAEARDDDTE